MEKVGLEALKLIQENLGIVITALLCVIAFMGWYIHKTYMKLIEGKDREIDRLYEDNQRLQNVLIPGLKELRREK